MGKKYLVLFIMFACFCFTCAETRNLIIAGIPEEPNRWITSSGQYRGLDIDIVDFIFKELKIPYTVILEEASTRLEGNWKKPVSPYDMVFTYSKNSEREVYLIYAEESHIDFSWNFFYRKEDQNKYKYDTYEDLRGIRIGATQGFSYTDEFWNASKSGILTLDTVVANEIQIEKLLKKRTELVPLNTQATLYEAKQKGILDKIAYLPKPIKSKPYYNTFVKSSTYPDIDTVIIKYNEILKRMKSDGTLKKILSEYGL